MNKVPLKLGIMSTISPIEIVDLIAALQTRHRGLELRLCDASAKDLRARLLERDLEVAIYALPGEEVDERTHALPLFNEQMAIAVHDGHRLANQGRYPVKELNGELHSSHELATPTISSGKRALPARRHIGANAMTGPWPWSRPGWDFAFMPENAVKHPGVVALPVVEPEFWRRVNLVTVRGRPYSPGVGALVREAMRKKWFGKKAVGQNNALGPLRDSDQAAYLAADRV